MTLSRSSRDDLVVSSPTSSWSSDYYESVVLVRRRIFVFVCFRFYLFSFVVAVLVVVVGFGIQQP